MTQRTIIEALLRMEEDSPVECPVELLTDRGKIKIVEVTLAGSEFLLVEFLEGDLSKRTLWMRYDGDLKLTYLTNYNSDGFLFNRNPDKRIESWEDDVPGGEYDPALEDLEIKVIDDPIVDMAMMEARR